MSKAEEKSREYVLQFLDKQYEKYGEHKQMELTRFDGYDMMTAYEEGYHQAEKDIIEKAAKWMESNLKGVIGGSIYIEDFLKAMKDE